MLTAPAGDNRPLRAAAQEHKRTRPAKRAAATHRAHTALVYRHDAITSAQRIQVSTGPSLPARALGAHCMPPHLKHPHPVALAR